MKLKIAFTGTHGAGKSTATLYLASLVKSLYPGLSVKVLEENVREISSLFDNKLNHTEFQKYCIVDQIHRELYAQAIYDIVICDRTAYDPIVYAKEFSVKVPEEYLNLANAHKNSYSLVYNIKPSNKVNIHSDGFRMTDKSMQIRLYELFRSYTPRAVELEQDSILTHNYKSDILRINNLESRKYGK